MIKKKNISLWRPSIFSRHPSHRILRAAAKNLPLFPYKVAIRFGSTTSTNDCKVEINSVESVKNSASKLRMKECFTEADIKTPHWWVWKKDGFNLCGTAKTNNKIEDLPYPIVVKSHYGSRGEGNTLVKDKKQLDSWIKDKTLANYLFEQFHKYSLEFRLHITEDGCFYTCRKALKKDTPASERWHFHDDTCCWLLETNSMFNKPNSWKDIVKDCVTGLKAIGADVLSFDVKVQAPKDREGNKRSYQDYIIIECNSASSFGEVTAQKYIEEIPKIIKRKYESLHRKR